VQTLFVAVPSLDAAVALLSHVRDAVADAVLACELLCRTAVEFVLRHLPGTVDPLLQPSPWYVLIDLTVGADVAEEVLASATAAGHLTDAALARSPAQASALWKLRDGISEAQKPEGVSIKHDISLPVSRIPRFVPMAIAAALRVLPDARPVPFGHLGDGNLHFNFSQPAGGDGPAFKARAPEVHQAVHDLVVAAGGSISAEHGIGVAKRDEIRRYKDPIEVALMTRIKAALDPQGIMNPGKGVA
jgi:FAD/FMN-containing dehydrogenase